MHGHRADLPSKIIHARMVMQRRSLSGYRRHSFRKLRGLGQHPPGVIRKAHDALLPGGAAFLLWHASLSPARGSKACFA